MEDRWYYFVGGILISAAIFSLLSMVFPQENFFNSVSSTGLIVKESVKEDLEETRSMDLKLVGYLHPFDGKNNLPEKVVYNSREYELRIVSESDLRNSDGLEITYLFSIGESEKGEFPVYFVESGVLDAMVVLNEPFFEGQEPFTK